MQMQNRLILVVEDQTRHFDALNDYLNDICATMRITGRIEHITVRKNELDALAATNATTDEPVNKKEFVRQTLITKIEARMLDAQSRGEQMILFFDNLMQLPGGRFYLEDFIRSIWSKPPNTWEAAIPIIVYTANSANGSKDALPHYPPRPRSAVVNAYPPVGVLGLTALEDAVRAALAPDPRLTRA